MNLNQLKVFDALARHHSFSKAAAELGLSQPTASVHMQNLEQEVDLKLVEQLGKTIYLTPAGELLLTYTKRILSLTEQATRALDELKNQDKGRLQIGSSTTPGIYFLPQILAQFKTIFPQVEIHFEVANSALIEERVAANLLDFGIVGHSKLTNQHLSYSPLWDDTLVAIVAPASSLAAKPTISPEDLRECLIMREPGSGTRKLVELSFAQLGLELHPAMEFTGTEGVKQAVIANLGVGIISKAAVIYEQKAGALAIKPIQGMELNRQFFLIHHKDKTITPLAESFLNHLKPDFPSAQRA